MSRRSNISAKSNRRQRSIAKACFEALEGRTYFGDGFVVGPATRPYYPVCTNAGPLPMFYIDGVPLVNSTDLQSNAFGEAFGLTRSWVGVDDASLNGNGWMISDLPYLNVLRNDKLDHSAFLQVVRAAGSGPLEFDGRSTFTPRGNNQNTLKYVAPYTDGGVPHPGMFTMRDKSGNTWLFYDVPRSAGKIDAEQG